MAIVNEDPAMVKLLLDCGADVHQRCCGKFFTPHDQQLSRRDSDQHEWFDVPTYTNYEGLTPSQELSVVCVDVQCVLNIATIIALRWLKLSRLRQFYIP